MTPGVLSEGPRWHQEREELLWVDILGRQLHRGTLAHDGSLDQLVTITIDRHVAQAGLDDGKPERDSGRVFSITGLGVRGHPCQPYRGTVPAAP